MGAEQSTGHPHTILEIYKIGKVREEEFESASTSTFYIRPGKEVVVLAPDERLGVANNEIVKFKRGILLKFI